MFLNPIKHVLRVFRTASKIRDNTYLRIFLLFQKPEKTRAREFLYCFKNARKHVHAYSCAASKTRENACISIDKNSVVFVESFLSRSLRVTCATRLFQESVPEKLIRERSGHRSNALFRYEKKSAEQERNVSDLLGPPRDVVDVVDVPDLDLNYEVRDEELCNMLMPSEVFDLDMSKSVFHNCTFNFATK